MIAVAAVSEEAITEDVVDYQEAGHLECPEAGHREAGRPAETPMKS